MRFPGLGPHWDPALTSIGQLWARGYTRVTATRARRFTLLPLYLHTCLFVVALIFPAEANAATTVPQDPLLAALGVTDSYGVALSKYTLSTDYGSVFDGGTQAVLATILQAEAAVFVAIGGVAIWFLNYVISFEFLTGLIEPVAVVVQGYASQIMPGVAAIAATIAAFFIAVNIFRENLPRAASQAAAALLIAVAGGAVAYSPISWVISGDGPLAQGRDVAVSLGSNSIAGAHNTNDTLTRLQGTLATSFVRRPLQTWNFGGQPDNTPGCAAAWSGGVNSGDPDKIKDGIRDCGAQNSAAMKATADHPNPGQLGTGLAMLFFAAIFALFCAVLGFHIVMEFFHAVTNAVKLLWGFAVGVIPGGPQASVINNFVAVLFSFVAMFGYVTVTILTGEIVTMIFARQGNGVTAMLSALILMVVAIRGVFKLSASLKHASSKTASGVLNSLGAPPAPPTVNIFEEKAGGFLHKAGATAVGVGVSMVGGRLAAKAPSAAHALQLVAPFIGGKRNSMVRNLDRGAQAYKTWQQRDPDNDKKDSGPDTADTDNAGTPPTANTGATPDLATPPPAPAPNPSTAEPTKDHTPPRTAQFGAAPSNGAGPPPPDSHANPAVPRANSAATAVAPPAPAPTSQPAPTPPPPPATGSSRALPDHPEPLARPSTSSPSPATHTPRQILPPLPGNSGAAVPSPFEGDSPPSKAPTTTPHQPLPPLPPPRATRQRDQHAHRAAEEARRPSGEGAGPQGEQQPRSDRGRGRERR